MVWLVELASLSDPDLVPQAVAINTLGVGITEFDLSDERAKALYDSGRAAAEEFLEREWSAPVAR